MTKTTPVVLFALGTMAFGVAVDGTAPTDVTLGDPLRQFAEETRHQDDPALKSHTDTVDNWNRTAVASFFHSNYTTALAVPMQWSGNVATCNAGTPSQAYINATFQMINYYRGMVGLPDATNDISRNAGCQEAALMQSINAPPLNHNPPGSWTCWTSAGAATSGSSNLAWGNAGPTAINAYIKDYGSANYFVGHRRWIFYPLRNAFGTGSVGETTSKANALYVFGGTVSRPATPDKVAWPPEGYVPYQVTFPRWSFSLNTSPSVSFASADVTMTENGSPVSLSVVSRTNNGYGDNTIVWEPSGLFFAQGDPDRRFTVTVSNISGPQTWVYDVVVMDPDTVTDTIFDDGFESGHTGAWSDTTP